MLPLPLTLRASGMCACTHDCMHACTKVNRRNVERKENTVGSLPRVKLHRVTVLAGWTGVVMVIKVRCFALFSG